LGDKLANQNKLLLRSGLNDIKNTEFKNYLLCLFLLSSVLVLSFFSGFKSYPVPFELAWQFSPIGVFHGVKAEYLSIESVSSFSGTFGFTWDYLIYFIKTCCFECPFYFFVFKKFSLGANLKILVLFNMVTHPAVFFLIPRFFNTYFISAMASEVFAASVEIVLAYLLLKRSYYSNGYSAFGSFLIFVANLTSWEVGMFV
jgi:hypothetical protein